MSLLHACVRPLHLPEENILYFLEKNAPKLAGWKRELIRIVRSRKLTQAAAARLLGVSQPRVSDLMRVKVDKFSSDALVEMLARAGVSVRVTVLRGRRVA